GQVGGNQRAVSIYEQLQNLLFDVEQLDLPSATDRPLDVASYGFTTLSC
ncbi:MAG: hypothetical protein QOF56_2296, partial [Acidobacteriaceae bacterium]|nr:hypothetical protein [Acidobacteriaceae bacterium]